MSSVVEPALPTAPSGIADEAGQPRFGSYAGSLPIVDRKVLRGAYAAGPRDLLQVKRWCFTSVYGRTAEGTRIAAVTLIGNLGYTAQTFVTVYDLDGKRTLAEASGMAPPMAAAIGVHPAAGLASSFSGGGFELALRRERGSDAYLHSVRVRPSRRPWGPRPEIAMDLRFRERAQPLTVIAPSTAGGVNVTQKSQAMPGEGTIRIGTRTLELRALLAATDYTAGKLPRHTAWRWASVTGHLSEGTPFGINLVEGFNEGSSAANENALWAGDRLISLPRVRFEFDARDTLRPWRVMNRDAGDDLQIELGFAPAAKHTENRDLLLVKSHYEQPVGDWSGTITDRRTGEVFRLGDAPGIAEDQDVLW